MHITSVKEVPLKANKRGEYRQSRVYFFPEPGSRRSGRWEERRNLAVVYGLLDQPANEYGRYNITDKFSSSAGCKTCNCSPGYIISARLGYDVHVSYMDDATKRRIELEARELAEAQAE